MGVVLGGNLAIILRKESFVVRRLLVFRRLPFHSCQSLDALLGTISVLMQDESSAFFRPKRPNDS